MLRNYFTIAFRSLSRNRLYSSINITGLAVGLAATLLILLYAKDEASYDRFHTHHPRLYRIVNDWLHPDGSVMMHNANTGHFQGPKFTENIPEIQGYVRIQGSSHDIRKDNEIKNHGTLTVDAGFFSLFSFPLLSGNPATALKNPRSVVLSEGMAEQFFGTADALGRTLEVKEGDRFETYQVTGVARRCPQNSSIKFDFLFPLVVRPEDMASNDNWISFFQNTFVVLAPGSDPKKVAALMQKVYEADAKPAIRKMREQFGAKETARYGLQPLTDMHLDTRYTAQNGLRDASNPMYAYILTGIALFILLIACINFINLTVARSVKRAKEIGIRKVVGGSRTQLMRQFLGESFALSLAAFLLAIVLVNLALPTFNALAGKALSFGYLLDWRLVAGYVAVFVATGLLAGFYPALVLSKYSPVQTLYGRFRLSGKNRLQKGLVVFQFGLASFLILAAITLYAQFDYLTGKELGYDDQNLVLVDCFGMKRDKAALFKERLLENPNIVAVAPKNAGYWGTVARVRGGKQLDFAYETVDEAFIPMLRIPVVQGRNFSRAFPSDSSRSVVVNEAFVKAAGWKQPLGQSVDFIGYNHETYTVVGVVKDHHFSSLREVIKPQLFTMRAANAFEMFHIKIRPGTETASLAAIAKTFKSLFPLNPYTYRFKERENEEQYEAEAKWKQVLLSGAVLTIFVSCIGLFGLATLATERRVKEIGIRKVLGASTGQLVRLISSDFLLLVVLAFVIAAPAAWYAANRWLQGFAYRIEVSWWMFASAGGLAVAVALLTVSFQAVKAALANPVKSLRSE